MAWQRREIVLEAKIDYNLAFHTTVHGCVVEWRRVVVVFVVDVCSVLNQNLEEIDGLNIAELGARRT